MGSEGQAAAALQAHWHQRGEERRPPQVDAALGATEARAARMASRAAAREVRNAQLPWPVLFLFTPNTWGLHSSSPSLS